MLGAARSPAINPDMAQISLGLSPVLTLEGDTRRWIRERACSTRFDRGCRRHNQAELRGTSRVKHKDLRPWLSVIVGGESLVSHASATLLVETARRSGLARQLSVLLGP
jgi:hypothetical protein